VNAKLIFRLCCFHGASYGLASRFKKGVTQKTDRFCRWMWLDVGRGWAADLEQKPTEATEADKTNLVSASVSSLASCSTSSIRPCNLCIN
jgi:hypothetical protein